MCYSIIMKLVYSPTICGKFMLNCYEIWDFFYFIDDLDNLSVEKWVFVIERVKNDLFAWLIKN